jgi:hypothetical protein
MRGAHALTSLCLLGSLSCSGSSTPASPTNTAGPGAQACSYAANGLTLNAVGGPATLAVEAAAGCRWTIERGSSADAWIAVETSGPSVGPATVSISVQPNRSFSSRTGTVVVRHTSGTVLATYDITQRGAGCLYSVDPTEQTVWFYGTSDGAGDTPIELKVHAEPAGCQWTATPASTWIRILYHSGFGTGDGTVYVSVDSWASPGPPRIGDVIVAGLSAVNPDARLTITETPR